MKLSIALADTNALPSAFVVFRGFRECIPKAAKLGFDGVELALRRAGEINVSELKSLLDDNNLEVSCISTGQVYADGGYMLTDENSGRRDYVKNILKELIDLAADFGGLVNIGRVRGQIGKRPKYEAEAIFIEGVRELCDYAEKRDVTLILEPVNRYEIDFINSVQEGVDLVKKTGKANLMLMPDVFHMNIEDQTIAGELARNMKYIRYIHLADSNRLAPGQGHIDFNDIFEQLLHNNYSGWVSAEILPRPDPDLAAKQTAEFLLPLLKDYNQRASKRRKEFQETLKTQ